MIRAIMGDITKVRDVMAIVNAANNSLLGGGGVDGAIHRAAGPALLEACKKLNGCMTGEAKVTKGYDLPAPYVIHTVGPVWNGGTDSESELLASCYDSSLTIAVEKGIRTIAFPSISTGAYRYPVEQAAEIAVNTVKQFLDKHPGMIDLVEWVLFDQRTFDVYQAQIAKIEQPSFFRREKCIVSRLSGYFAFSGKVLWQPDRLLPYVIHGEAFDDYVIISPEVVHVPDSDLDCLMFLTNREHLFRGRLIEKKRSEILFERQSDNETELLRVAVMTQEEFEARKEYYAKHHVFSREEIVKVYETELRCGV